jgi:hypothetical protein
LSTSLFLARLIGPVALVGGLGVLLNRGLYGRLAEQFLSSPALIYLSGLITMVAGLAIVLKHNLWVADWRVIVTCVGWISVLAGALRMLIPERIQALGGAFAASDTMLLGGGLIWLGVGAMLSYRGYLG